MTCLFLGLDYLSYVSLIPIFLRSNGCYKSNFMPRKWGRQNWVHKFWRCWMCQFQCLEKKCQFFNFHEVDQTISVTDIAGMQEAFYPQYLIAQHLNCSMRVRSGRDIGSRVTNKVDRLCCSIFLFSWFCYWRQFDVPSTCHMQKFASKIALVKMTTTILVFEFRKFNVDA